MPTTYQRFLCKPLVSIHSQLISIVNLSSHSCVYCNYSDCVRMLWKLNFHWFHIKQEQQQQLKKKKHRERERESIAKLRTPAAPATAHMPNKPCEPRLRLLIAFDLFGQKDMIQIINAFGIRHTHIKPCPELMLKPCPTHAKPHCVCVHIC